MQKINANQVEKNHANIYAIRTSHSPYSSARIFLISYCAFQMISPHADFSVGAVF